MSTEQVKPLLVDVRSASALLSLGQSTVRRMVAERRLDSIRIGRRVLLPVSAIEDLIGKSRAAADSSQAVRNCCPEEETIESRRSS